jgi:hypothetical protein
LLTNGKRGRVCEVGPNGAGWIGGPGCSLLRTRRRGRRGRRAPPPALTCVALRASGICSSCDLPPERLKLLRDAFVATMKDRPTRGERFHQNVFLVQYREFRRQPLHCWCVVNPVLVSDVVSPSCRAQLRIGGQPMQRIESISQPSRARSPCFPGCALV